MSSLTSQLNEKGYRNEMEVIFMSLVSSNYISSEKLVYIEQ